MLFHEPTKFRACQVGWLHHAAHNRAFPAYCRKWQCDDCGPDNSAALRRRVAGVEWTYFLTLTFAGPDVEGAQRPALQIAQRAWSMLRKWLRRRGLRNFLRVTERGEARGRVHHHVLVEIPYLSYSELHAELRRCGYGSVAKFVRVVNLGSRHAARYVTKYVSKAHSHWSLPRGVHRAQTSVPRPPRERGWWLWRWWDLSRRGAEGVEEFFAWLYLKRKRETDRNTAFGSHVLGGPAP